MLCAPADEAPLAFPFATSSPFPLSDPPVPACLPRSSQAHLAAHPYATSPADGTPLGASAAAAGGVPLAGSGAQTPYYDAHATPPSSGPLAAQQQQQQLGGQQAKAGPAGQQQGLNGGYADNDGAHGSGGGRPGGLRKFFCCG